MYKIFAKGLSGDFLGLPHPFLKKNKGRAAGQGAVVAFPFRVLDIINIISRTQAK